MGHVIGPRIKNGDVLAAAASAFRRSLGRVVGDGIVTPRCKVEDPIFAEIVGIGGEVIARDAYASMNVRALQYLDFNIGNRISVFVSDAPGYYSARLQAEQKICHILAGGKRENSPRATRCLRVVLLRNETVPIRLQAVAAWLDS